MKELWELFETVTTNIHHLGGQLAMNDVAGHYFSCFFYYSFPHVFLRKCVDGILERSIRKYFCPVYARVQYHSAVGNYPITGI